MAALAVGEWHQQRAKRPLPAERGPRRTRKTEWYLPLFIHEITCCAVWLSHHDIGTRLDRRTSIKRPGRYSTLGPHRRRQQYRNSKFVLCVFEPTRSAKAVDATNKSIRTCYNAIHQSDCPTIWHRESTPTVASVLHSRGPSP